ncbi:MULTISPECIES: L-aspartate oxidase [Acidobacterium]|uniref:L-aspartate oxidase n=1 Tax=Acidobacterium capsulatum (strain ATCC 51196 / DSM 11244 / BCRC 80197 / JCM 7670 / NBRC 15755 / NCIMB 13165 / 161) TaxID=240015 RepID=C1F549_ACIC5|nr:MULTISPECIES: L-aspartate oxidase [Acidobacterium]ACO31426.1 L-aspartate oxidase [Acidobacterium capsulatum ATCC 51196]HCT61164.1 L-aspartate oxidase [Acidobacterium sp.]
MAEAAEFDFVVVGAGIAGLRAAIELADAGRVLVLTKEALGESNTSYAQGGIAVAMSGAEDVALHLEDTVAAGDGLVDREAARVLVEEGPLRVEELLAWDTRFDRENGELLRTLEGAHSRHRVLHANGDATGAEIGRALLAHAEAHARVTLREWTLTTDLLMDGDEAVGVVMMDRDGRQTQVRARAVLLASGGAGQVYSDTTNPAVATGDGIAMAARAGARIADMEFYQFHPTALSLPGVARFLLSEALRGEGAVLRNAAGEQFMERYHALKELAPRDVVARAITREGMGERGEARPVYLDMRHVTGVDLAARFPGISAFLTQHGLALGRDLIPVRPAAHYLMGGVRTDVDGRTSLRRLYAAGEVACTGVHGANRLASNSLLEGLVFGARAARAMRDEAALRAGEGRVPQGGVMPGISRADLQQTMWQKAGLLRDAAGLREAQALLEQGGEARAEASREALELRNLWEVARLIVAPALAREESRGAHFRNDFPERRDAEFQKHSDVVNGVVRFV